MGLTFANKITVGRILAVPFFIATVLYYTPERDSLRYVALGIFLTAVISDVIDGYIARTRHQKTQAGVILDPLADKILLISAFLCLYLIGGNFDVLRFPLWLVVALISRDVILLAGALIIQMVTGRLTMEANFWGKTTTFLQIVCVIGMLLQLEASRIFWPLALVVTFISGVIYIKEGMTVINAHSPEHSSR